MPTWARQSGLDPAGAPVRDERPREVEGVAGEVGDHLDHLGPVGLVGLQRAGQRGHLGAGSSAMAPSRVSMASGSMSGSSPCRFTTISGAGRSLRAASATRSVPVAAGPVMMAVAPAALGGSRDARIVGGHRHHVHAARPPRALDDVSDDGAACQIGEGFPGKTARSVPGRNDDGDSSQAGAVTTLRDRPTSMRGFPHRQPLATLEVGGRAGSGPRVVEAAAVPRVVRARFVVERNYAGWRLDRLPHGEDPPAGRRAKAAFLVANRLDAEDGRVVGPGLRWSSPASPSRSGGRPSRSRRRRSHFGVVHDDGELLVVDKPAGLPIHPTARYFEHTFTAVARARYPDRKVDPAHRHRPRDLRPGRLRHRAGVDLAAQAVPSPPGGSRRPTWRWRSAGRRATPSWWTRRWRSRSRARCGCACTSTRRGPPPAPPSRCWARRTAPDGARGGAAGLPPAHRPAAPDPRPPPPRRPAAGGRQDLRPRRAHLRPLHQEGDDRRATGPRSGSPRHALHAWRLELPHPRTGERDGAGGAAGAGAAGLLGRLRRLRDREAAGRPGCGDRSRVRRTVRYGRRVLAWEKDRFRSRGMST